MTCRNSLRILPIPYAGERIYGLQRRCASRRCTHACTYELCSRIPRPSGPSRAPWAKTSCRPPPQPPDASSPGGDQPRRCPHLTARAQALVHVAAPTARSVWLGGLRWESTDATWASLPPNPEVGVEVENFAGSGALRGFQSAEITIHLSQLIELAGKRQKRTRVAALERDLVAWDYEATRIEVLTEVTQAFVEVLSAQQRLRLNLELVRLAEQVLRTAARAGQGRQGVARGRDESPGGVVYQSHCPGAHPT